MHVFMHVCECVLPCVNVCMHAGRQLHECMHVHILSLVLACCLFPCLFLPLPTQSARSFTPSRSTTNLSGQVRGMASREGGPECAAAASSLGPGVYMHACMHTCPCTRAALARACLLCLSVCQTPPPHRTKHQNQPQRRTASTWVFLHYDCVRVCARERERARARTHTRTRTHTHTHTPRRCLSIKSVFYPHCGPRRKHVLLPRWAPQSAKPDLGASGVSIP